MGTQSIINGNTVFKIEKYPINEGNIVLQEIVLNGVKVVLNQFNLEDIDKLREMILYHNSATPFYLETGNSNLPNYIKYVCGGRNGSGKLLSASKQYGLLLKTYNSDIMNNWINTSWIDGVNGINSITAVSTEGGSFTIDTLTLAKKVYDMLNRVAISGGSYKDWLDTVYTDSFKETMETPTFEGGASQEVGFQEVVSNSSEVEEPLGTLAGRGTMVGSQNGGTIKIKTKEPSYIIGICSLTPRIDYSQGNRFDTLFKTLDDLHKPALDGIGFQDLITDKMAYWSTIIPNSNEMLMKTCGKQPAWLDYMTNYNRCYGEFADNYSEAFMVLNRNYKWDEDEDIEDLTTYIDPAKYNYIFADVDLSAMNFWVQIKVEMETRRLISAKSIPNL